MRYGARHKSGTCKEHGTTTEHGPSEKHLNNVMHLRTWISNMEQDTMVQSKWKDLELQQSAE